jgi:hypothetical protein
MEEIGIQDAPNKDFVTRLDEFYIRFIKERAEEGEYHLEDASLQEFLSRINKWLGNPKGL